MSQKKQPTLKDKLHELEAVVTWFEQDDLDVEQAIAKFEAGSKLADEIAEQLASLENTVTVLKGRFDR